MCALALSDDLDYLNLERQVEADKRENKDSQRRLSGRPVKYGDIVQLQHDFTDMYLSMNAKKSAVLSYDNLRLELRQDSDKSNFFRIVPPFKADAEGGVIFPADTIYLESVKRPGALAHVAVC